MKKEVISDHQSIILLATYLFGSTLIIGTAGEAKQDAWIAILMAVIIAVLAFFVYARVLYLFPALDFLDILEAVLGKYLAKPVALLYIWYAFHLGALVIRNFSEFMEIAAMPETPNMIIIFSMGIICIIALKDGIEVLSRLSTFVFPLILLLIVVVVPLSLTEAHLQYLKPILAEGWKPVLAGAFSTFAFPFGETIIFSMAVGGCFENKKSVFKSFYVALIISSIIMLIVSVRNIMVLGFSASMMYFPSYMAVSIINIGDFIQRIEVSVAVIFLFAGFVKISICLYAVCKGFTKVFKLGDYRKFVAPIGLLMLIFTDIVYENTMEMLEWIRYYPYYAIPFQIILPIIIWIAAEIKVRKRKEEGKV